MEPERDVAVVGEKFLVAMVLTFLGISHIVIGLSAILRDHLDVMQELHHDYLLHLGVTAWG